MRKATTNHSKTFKIEDVKTFKRKAFTWASSFNACCFLDNNQHSHDVYHSYEGLLAVGIEDHLLQTQSHGAFRNLKEFCELKKDWLFGFLSYDLKNDVECLSSKNKDNLEMPEMHFFQPTYVFEIQSDFITIHSNKLKPDVLFKMINSSDFESKKIGKKKSIPKPKSRISKERYLEIIDKIRNHIREGDIYEMNFCQEFFIENIRINPVDIFNKLNTIAHAPFAAFYKMNDRFLMCASPERFLKKEGQKLISQPIKGTIKRGRTKKEDLKLKDQLFNSPKDRSENVMIVDLVRNDLARSCKPGSIKVEELFGIYGFEKVYQMISTISGELREEVHFTEAIKAAFAMGSMTGAPKIMSMELIEKYEITKRGIYSGAVGYIKPDGDFDFNVVIRSLLYNATKEYLSFQVGGAVVYDSNPEGEYEECLLKSKNVLEVLEKASQI